MYRLGFGDNCSGRWTANSPGDPEVSFATTLHERQSAFISGSHFRSGTFTNKKAGEPAPVFLRHGRLLE